MWQPARALALVGTTVALIAASQGTAASSAQTSTDYVVGSLGVPGVDTGLVLTKGRRVTVTATGTVCQGTGYCTTPAGTSLVDTKDSPYAAGFVLPGAPAYGLVARIGTGSWMQVGTGPVRIRGTGDLVFAFNDDWFPDNTGSFTVTVTYAHGAATQASEPCTPGNGYGDSNHEHTGPPGQTDDTCRPGWGYGDTNHEHSGPPGQNKDASGGNNGKPHR
jgi:hypothetical protein